MLTGKRLRNQRAANIAEFGPVLFVIVILIFIPLADLITYLCAVSTVQLAVTEGSRSAATADSPNDALKAMETAVNNVKSSGMGSFTKLRGIDGFNNSGCKLTLHVTSALNGSSNTFAIPGQFPLAEDFRPETKSNKSDLIYQYQVEGTFEVSPLLDMSAIPFLKVPMLSPTNVTYSAEHAVENLQGLNAKP